MTQSVEQASAHAAIYSTSPTMRALTQELGHGTVNCVAAQQRE
jgi:hypothetical protein